jgi:hypothetical protein
MFAVDDNIIFLDEEQYTWNNARVVEVLHDADSYVNLNPGDFYRASGVEDDDNSP